jgi:hypothetical protein
MHALLEAAGQQRFEQRVEAYAAALRCGGPSTVQAALWTGRGSRAVGCARRGTGLRARSGSAARAGAGPRVWHAAR